MAYQKMFCLFKEVIFIVSYLAHSELLVVRLTMAVGTARGRPLRGNEEMRK